MSDLFGLIALAILIMIAGNGVDELKKTNQKLDQIIQMQEKR